MISDYIKGFFALFLLMKILLYFIPKNVFEKYIAFFAGVLLVIGLLYPVLQFFDQKELGVGKQQYEEWEKQLLEISYEAEQLEKSGEEFAESVYQKIEEAQSVDEVVIETIKIDSEVQMGGKDE